MTWTPTAAQRAAARERVGAAWARLLAEEHPGHRFVVEWGEGDELTGSTALPREIDGEVVDEERGRAAA